MTEQTQSAFTLTRQDNGIAILTMDVPGESMNTLKAAFGEEMTVLLDEIENDSSIKGVVLVSGKDSSFVAGADITMLDACSTADEAMALAKGGQDIFNRIENMRQTFVAAIHGPALGGAWNWQWLVITEFVPKAQRLSWACQKCSSGCCRAVVARNVCRNWPVFSKLLK